MTGEVFLRIPFSIIVLVLGKKEIAKFGTKSQASKHEIIASTHEK